MTLSNELDCRIWINDEVYYDIKNYNNPSNLIANRNNGPALEYQCGDKIWCKDGLIHRESGPAVYLDLGKRYYWYINGFDITQEIENWFKENNWEIENELDTDEKKTMFKLKFL